MTEDIYQPPQIPPKIFKGNPFQTFSKYISQLLYFINITDIDSKFIIYSWKHMVLVA